MLEMLDHSIRIGSTPTFLYFDLYLYSAYAAHYVYIDIRKHDFGVCPLFTLNSSCCQSYELRMFDVPLFFKEN